MIIADLRSLYEPPIYGFRPVTLKWNSHEKHPVRRIVLWWTKLWWTTLRAANQNCRLSFKNTTLTLNLKIEFRAESPIGIGTELHPKSHPFWLTASQFFGAPEPSARLNPTPRPPVHQGCRSTGPEASREPTKKRPKIFFTVWISVRGRTRLDSKKNRWVCTLGNWYMLKITMLNYISKTMLWKNCFFVIKYSEYLFWLS